MLATIVIDQIPLPSDIHSSLTALDIRCRRVSPLLDNVAADHNRTTRNREWRCSAKPLTHRAVVRSGHTGDIETVAGATRRAPGEGESAATRMTEGAGAAELSSATDAAGYLAFFVQNC